MKALYELVFLGNIHRGEAALAKSLVKHTQCTNDHLV